MSAPAWTAGPLEAIRFEGENVWGVMGLFEFTAARCSKADAQLYAAAPALYEALEALEAAIRDFDEYDTARRMALRKAIAASGLALSKARGEPTPSEGGCVVSDLASRGLGEPGESLFEALKDLEALLSEVAPEYAESTVAANARAALARHDASAPALYDLALTFREYAEDMSKGHLVGSGAVDLRMLGAEDVARIDAVLASARGEQS